MEPLGSMPDSFKARALKWQLPGMPRSAVEVPMVADTKAQESSRSCSDYG